MTLKRHQRFYKEVDKEWSNKLFGFIESQSDKPWNWQWISCNPNITIETIEAHLDKPWDWYYISRNPNITMNFIDAHLDKPWNWYWISCNPNITMDIIETYPDKPWNWHYISRNPSITIEIIEAHPDKPWNWSVISGNPNLTMKIIEAHPDKPWEWILVSQISFQKDKEQFIERKAREYMAAYKIRRAWLECYLSPYTIIGKKRLEKEYNAMVKEHNELFGYTSS